MTLLLWLRTVRNTLTCEDLWALLIGAVSLASMLAAGVTLTGLKKWVMLLMTLLYFQAASRLQQEESIRRFVCRLTDLLTLFLAAAYLWDRQRLYRMNGVETEYLTFGFSNPNLAGLFLICLFMLQMGRMKGRFWPVHGLLALILGYFVIRTQSRNCIGVLGLFAILWILHRDRPLILSRPAACCVAWFPAMFAAVYLLTAGCDWIQSFFRFFSGEGKELSSRVEVWTRAVRIISRAPLTGDPAAISVSQLHNSHLDIAASYGIPVLMLVCGLLKRYLRKPIPPGFVCCLLLGMGESALFSGGLGIYIFAGAFLLSEEGVYETA